MAARRPQPSCCVSPLQVEVFSGGAASEALDKISFPPTSGLLFTSPCLYPSHTTAVYFSINSVYLTGCLRDVFTYIMHISSIYKWLYDCLMKTFLTSDKQQRPDPPIGLNLNLQCKKKKTSSHDINTLALPVSRGHCRVTNLLGCTWLEQ